MDLIQAMQERHSVRAYTLQPIEDGKRQKLDNLIRECNQESGLHIQIRYDDPSGSDSKLAHYDAAEHTQYCQTLLAYLLCHHSLQETCQRLYTHRNTVLYRIRRMKEDFGIPLDDPNRHLELLLSVSLELLAQHQENLFVHGLTLETPRTMPHAVDDTRSVSPSPSTQP